MLITKPRSSKVALRISTGGTKDMGACLRSLSKSRKGHEKNDQNPSQHFDMAALPSQLREKIWRCLDNRSKKTIRRVCSLFKSEIDLGSGLAVKVDDTSVENLRLLRCVEVRDAIIVKMDRSPSRKIFRTKLNVQFLQFNCPVTPPMFSSVIMPLGENLATLSFMSNSLMFKSILPHDVAMEASLKDHKGYIFPRLKSLEIQYGSFQTSRQTLEVFNFNMVTVMKSFYCPRLVCFTLRPDRKVLLALSNSPSRIPKRHIEWENTSLKNFVYTHRSSLRLLDLFLYSREIDEDLHNYGDYPTHLTDFIVLVPYVTIAKRLTYKSFWKDVILSSANLIRLILQVDLWRNYEDCFKILPGILAKNSESLRIIRLESFAVEEEDNDDVTTNYRRNSAGFTLNFNIFSVCSNLKTFELIQLNNRKFFVGINLVHLPPTLERLELKNIFIPSQELVILQDLPKLQRLSLSHVGSSGIFGVNDKALKKIWANETLEFLEVVSFNFEHNKGEMDRIIKRTEREYKDKDTKPTHTMSELNSKSVILRKKNTTKQFAE